jgi:3-hydroxyacyl-[acyl-carrier-protein] dehydratase
MLNDNFFSIGKIVSTEFEINAVLNINASHLIFEGHFPGQPIVPGVCMMQMLKEVLEISLQKRINLVSAAEMKFLAIINPIQNSSINANLKYALNEKENLYLIASLSVKDITYFKFKGNFLIKN